MNFSLYNYNKKPQATQGFVFICMCNATDWKTR